MLLRSVLTSVVHPDLMRKPISGRAGSRLEYLDDLVSFD